LNVNCLSPEVSRTRPLGVHVSSVSVEQLLLEKADVAAKRRGVSRAALFEMGLRVVLGGSGKMAG
jgi:hypothetical protein